MEEFIDQKIAENEGLIEKLGRDNKILGQQKQSSKEKSGMGKWVGFRFESSSGLTEEFASFAKEYRQAIKKMIGDKFELVGWNRGHFYISGFVKNKTSGKYVYFSTSDVRHFPNEWYNNILVRTTEHDKDYTGGRNDFSSFDNLWANFVMLS